MDKREAVEIIKNFPDWNTDDQWLGADEMQDLADTLSESLEKQIPKLVLTTRTSCGIKFGRCPGCGKEIDEGSDPFYHTDKNCLQLIRWSKEKQHVQEMRE